MHSLENQKNEGGRTKVFFCFTIFGCGGAAASLSFQKCFKKLRKINQSFYKVGFYPTFRRWVTRRACGRYVWEHLIPAAACGRRRPPVEGGKGVRVFATHVVTFPEGEYVGRVRPTTSVGPKLWNKRNRQERRRQLRQRQQI